MSRCDNHKCPRPQEQVESEDHAFYGYGYRVVFHPECCPLTVEGEPCAVSHEEEHA